MRRAGSPGLAAALFDTCWTCAYPHPVPVGGGCPNYTYLDLQLQLMYYPNKCFQCPYVPGIGPYCGPWYLDSGTVYGTNLGSYQKCDCTLGNSGCYQGTTAIELRPTPVPPNCTYNYYWWGYNSDLLDVGCLQGDKCPAGQSYWPYYDYDYPQFVYGPYTYQCPTVSCGSGALRPLNRGVEGSELKSADTLLRKTLDMGLSAPSHAASDAVQTITGRR